MAMEQKQTGEVLIVGAGPTGMVAALELSRFGIPVRLIEKAHEPATTSRAVGVQARTLELFEQRGISAPLLAKGNPGRGVSVYGAGKRVFRLDFDHINSKYKYILFISQAETEQNLRDALARNTVNIEWDTTMVSYAQAERHSGITAILEHGDGSLEKLDCAYLIAAEGAHSNVRETSGLEFEGKALVEDYALGDFYIDGDLSDSDLHIFSSTHGFMGMFPMGDKRFRMIASNPFSEPSKDTKPTIEELQKMYDQRSTLPARFHDLAWSSWFRINSRMVHTMQVGRAFLGGDSAHIHSPAGAQGMNTGMQDMVNLGWKLAMVMRGEAKPELLETYTADRVPVIENVLTKTEGLTRMIGDENPLFRSVFNHIAPWITSTETVQLSSTERMSQIALNYRNGPLSESHGHAGSLEAGDRVPDLAVTVLNREGSTEQKQEQTTLFQLMDPSLFTLFYSNLGDAVHTHSEVQSQLGGFHSLVRGYQIAAADSGDKHFKELFGLTSSIKLVRPDGYIAFTGSEQSVPQLARFLSKWLISPTTSDSKEAQHG